MRAIRLFAVVLLIGVAAFADLNVFASEAEGKSIKQLADKVGIVREALKRYKTDHDSLPRRVIELVPKYLNLEDVKFPGSEAYLWSTLVLIPPMPDPENASVVMIGFTTMSVDGQRIVVTSDLEGLVVGDMRFQEWVSGTGER